MGKRKSCSREREREFSDRKRGEEHACPLTKIFLLTELSSQQFKESRISSDAYLNHQLV